MEIGCKFRHEVSETKFFDEGCTNHLCQYRHKTVGKSIIKDTTNVDKDRYKVDGVIESNDNETSLETTKDSKQEGIDFVTSTPKKQ